MTRSRITRYTLLDEIQTDANDPAIALWRGHDDVLDREVTLRILHADDPRAAAFLGAARAAALVDDRRLLRVLDIFTVPEDEEGPSVVVVVSERSRGRTLVEVVAEQAQPMPIDEAVAIVDDVARAIAAGLSTNVAHGRLRPNSVILTDAGEVRVRGLAVDAALWGPLDPEIASREIADVDGLGALLYWLITATWPSAQGFAPLPPAPRVAGRVLPPSNVRADVPRHIDDCIARSVLAAGRPRGVRHVRDAAEFAAMLGIARDHVAPTGDRRPRHSSSSGQRARRIIGVIVAFVAVVAIGLLGWQTLTHAASPWSDAPDSPGDAFLTSAAEPMPSDDGVDRILPIASIRSFDPLGDDDGNGKADGRTGTEHDDQAALAIDHDPTTAWTSNRYRADDLDGKGGVGLIVDLGTSTPVRAVDLGFTGAGAPVEIRVADKVFKDPSLWSMLTSAGAGNANISLRGARPITGRYVLVWFPAVPPLATSSSRYQVQVNELAVHG